MLVFQAFCPELKVLALITKLNLTFLNFFKSAENRHLPQNLVIYSFKDGAYIPIPRTTNVVTIFEYEGTAIHVDSAEAKAQIARDGGEKLQEMLRFFVRSFTILQKWELTRESLNCEHRR